MAEHLILNGAWTAVYEYVQNRKCDAKTVCGSVSALVHHTTSKKGA